MNENADTWENRINAASAVLKITPTDLEKILDSLGVTKEPMGLQMLDDEEVFKFGDFRADPNVAGKFAVAQLRMAMKFLRPSKAPQVVAEPDERTKQLHALGFKTKLEDADTAALLNLYMPDRPNDPVSLALKKRFASAAIIAFHPDGKVAVPETMEYVAGLEQGYPPAESIMVGGKLAKLWPVGVKPNVMVEEDPLYHDTPLRNGCSTVNFRNWSKVSLRCRQLCRVILDRGDINPDNKDATLRLLERAQSGYDALMDAYPEAELELRELEAKGNLPKLMVPLGAAPKVQNPFGVRRQY